jgi:drug/metabolite transporter (DMT)-like permease
MRPRAIQRLILATLLWGLSFPATKALALTQSKLLGASGAFDSWFFASLLTVCRFSIAAGALLLLSARTLRRFRGSEFAQGIGLGLFGGVGILLQVDGMAYTAASTSAFLTQGTCLFIPLYLACRQRQWPAGRILLSCVLVIAGAAVLAGVDWHQLRVGRGELETLAAAAFFAGQILWLNRADFASNNVNHFSLVMFAVMALVCLPVAIVTSAAPADWLRAWASPAAVAFLAILIFPCTFGAYMLMNHWQRHVTATQAGLIYCFEPVFASAFALVLPGIFSRWAGVEYANETVTACLLIGGALITIANVLTLTPAPVSRPADTPAAGANARADSSSL